MLMFGKAFGAYLIFFGFIFQFSSFVALRLECRVVDCVSGKI